MENLVGRKVKCVKRYRNLTEKKEYEIKSVNERTFEITEDDGINDTWNIEWIKGYDEDGEYHFELLPNEPQFKQGDKVLVSDNGAHWIETQYAIFFDNNHFTYSSQGNLIKWQHIKPYEEEIKVGDWVKVNNEQAIIKINEIGIKYLDNYTKITNPELIELLNNEL